MSFSSAASYDRFMGRYSIPLAPQFADLADVTGGRALDVGCGPGALTGELVMRLGAGSVSAVDPSEPFVAAIRERYPAVAVQCAPVEELPHADGAFDVTLAHLVVHFMRDPVAGLSEMRRVTRPQGVVAACVWDHAGGSGPLSSFWTAARRLDPGIGDEGPLPGTRRGDLGELFGAAGLLDIEETTLTVSVEHGTFDDWWEPFTLGVGPAGSYTASLDPVRQDRLRQIARDLHPEAPFVVTARAWAATGIAPHP